jgi:glycosyltransferase involved in cell wall biosynthesis
MNHLSIGVAIPCYKGHIDSLHHLLDSIEHQTRLPDRVVISCSSCEPSDIPSSYYEYSYPVEIYTHSDVKNAAQNRNIALSYLTTDIVSFFDADDIMHPQRLQVVERCFEISSMMLFAHSYETKSVDFVYYDMFPFDINKLFVCSFRSVQHIDYLHQPVIHNGQYSVRRTVLEKVRFREEKEYFGREDTIFGGDVLLTFPNQNAFCPLLLSKYMPSRTQIKEIV